MGYCDYKVRKFKCYRLCSDIQNQLKAKLLKSTYLIITPFQIPTILDCRGFIFYFYVQGTGTSRTTQSTSWSSTHFTTINYEKIQLTSRTTQQPGWSSTHLTPENWSFWAERPSKLRGAPSPSSPLYVQNDTATGLEHYVVAVYDPNFFLFLNRLQAQAHSNRRGQPRLSRPFFFYFFN